MMETWQLSPELPGFAGRWFRPSNPAVSDTVAGISQTLGSLAESFADATRSPTSTPPRPAPDEARGPGFLLRGDGDLPGVHVGAEGRRRARLGASGGGRGRHGRRAGRLVRGHGVVQAPAGLLIPHTAIIRKKDQLGELGHISVRENFLSPQNVETKLGTPTSPGRVGKWLSEREHAERVAGEVASVMRVGVELLNTMTFGG